MNRKKFGLPVLTLFAAVALSAASNTWAVENDSCKAARARVAAFESAWKDGSACDLSDDDRLSVRPAPYGAALTHFRSVKDEFMKAFDKNSAGSFGANLQALRDASEEFSKAHPDRGEMNEKLGALNAKIDAFNKAVDNMRGDGKTNSATLHAIDVAMGDLQDTCEEQHSAQDYCPGTGTGALETLDALFQKEAGTSADPALASIKEKVHALNDDGTGLGDAANILVRMRRIYLCRSRDEALGRDRACKQAADTVPPAAPGAPAFGPPQVILVDNDAPAKDATPLIMLGSSNLDPDMAKAARAFFNKDQAPAKPDFLQQLREQGWNIPAAEVGSAKN